MIRSIIIDDEENSRIVLHNLLTEFCEGIKVVATTDSIQSGIDAIKTHQPSLVFLDIEMPEENGFKLFDYFEKPSFDVIFTTAYDQYALKAFRFAAVDYLLKPIDLEELQNAIEKYKSKQNTLINHQRFQTLRYNFNNSFRKLALPTSDGFIFVELDTIIRFEADSNYTIVFVKDGTKYLISRTLREYDELLSGLNFLRISRSHLINFNHIKKYVRSRKPIVEMADGSQINIAPSRKKEFLEKLNSF